MPDHVHMMLSIPPKYAVSQDRQTTARWRIACLSIALQGSGAELSNSLATRLRLLLFTFYLTV